VNPSWPGWVVGVTWRVYMGWVEVELSA